MIRSNTHAFEIIETNKNEIPFKAIRYLYYQPPAEDIRKKVIFWLENAYNEKVLSEQSNYNPNAPIWFAIVAEKYLEERLIDPVIKLFTTVDEDWDLLNEQGAFLICQLCEKLGDTAIQEMVGTILQQVEAKSDLPYLYLFESFRFIDPDKYSQQILELFDSKSHWLEALLAFLPRIRFSQKKHPELLASIHEKLELLRLEFEMMETLDHIDRATLKEIINCQELLSNADYPKTKQTHQERADWETYLLSLENLLEPEEIQNEKIPSPVKKTEKVSRNANCPCGSGKKYKRCCL